MAKRNVLQISKLENLKKWLVKDGWELLPLSNNPYEVLRASKAGKHNPLIIYSGKSNEHLSFADRDIPVIGAFIRDQKKPQTNADWIRSMTENEAIEELQTAIELAKMCTQNLERKREIQAYEMAIKALEEVQKYRAIGTPEQCRAAMEKQTETLTVDKAKTIAAKAICIGCGYLADCKCDYNGGNCMVSKPMLESVLKSFDDWNRRANDGKID